MVTLELRTSQ